MEKNNESQELLNLDLDLDTATPEQLKEFAGKVKDANKQLYERTKKAETTKKESDELLRKAAEKLAEKKPDLQENKIDESFRESLEFLAEGYKRDEIEFIQKNGGKAALQNPFVKASLDAIRTQRKAEDAADIDGSGKGGVNVRKYTEAELSKMSSSQIQKIIEAQV